MKNNNLLKRILKKAAAVVLGLAIAIPMTNIPVLADFPGDNENSAEFYAGNPGMDTVTFYKWTRIERYDQIPTDDKEYYAMILWERNGKLFYIGGNKTSLDDNGKRVQHCNVKNFASEDHVWDGGVDGTYDTCLNTNAARFITSNDRGALRYKYQGTNGNKGNGYAKTCYLFAQKSGGGYKQVCAYSSAKITRGRSAWWEMHDKSDLSNPDTGEYCKWMILTEDEVGKSGGEVCDIEPHMVNIVQDISVYVDPKFKAYDDGHLELDAFYTNNSRADCFYFYIGEKVDYARMKVNHTIAQDVVQNINGRVIIPETVTLKVSPGAVLSIEGTLINNGRIVNEGTIVLQKDSCIQPFDERVDRRYVYMPNEGFGWTTARRYVASGDKILLQDVNGTTLETLNKNDEKISTILEKGEFYYPGTVISRNGGSVVMMSGSRMLAGRKNLSYFQLDNAVLENFGTLVSSSAYIENSTINNYKAGQIAIGFDTERYLGSFGDRMTSFAVKSGSGGVAVMNLPLTYFTGSWGNLKIKTADTSKLYDLPKNGGVKSNSNTKIYNEGVIAQKDA